MVGAVHLNRLGGLRSIGHYHRDATVQWLITFKALVIPFSAELPAFSD